MGADEKTALDYLQVEKRHPIDETPKPKWATAPDGRYTDVSSDERFDGLFRDWLDDACHHERPAIVRWVNSGGQTIYNWFCRDCGTKLSSNIKAAVAKVQKVFDVPMDEVASRSHAYKAERERRLDVIMRSAAESAQSNNREAYDDYLRSGAWQALRSKVLIRAGHVCEGCLERPAEHVHHITYANIGNEFAFELRALCAACHRRAHDREAA